MADAGAVADAVTRTVVDAGAAAVPDAGPGLSLLAGAIGGQGSRFRKPQGVATDGTNLFVADTEDHTIRKIVIATGVVTTLAGSAGLSGRTDGTGSAALFNAPSGVATDGTNLFVTDSNNHTIRKIVVATGVVTTLAGKAWEPGKSDGTGAAARFEYPRGVATDGTNLFVADSINHTSRKIVISTGVVTTLAGTSVATGIADGTGSAARFRFPAGVATVGTNLFVADSGNHTIRKIEIATGVVTTLAGTAGVGGRADGTGAAARFYFPAGVATDGTDLFVADSWSHTIRKIVIATRVVKTLAGTTGAEGSADGAGATARFRFPAGVATDGTNLYVADTDNNSIRKIVIATTVVTTLAGSSGAPGSSDGTGSAARFQEPFGIATDGTNLFVADSDGRTIRKIVIATGVVTTLAGSGWSHGSADGAGAAARFSYPAGVATDGTNLFVTDTYNQTIRKIVIATGIVTTLAGRVAAAESADGTGAAARFNEPEGIATDGTNLFVADTGNNTIRKIVIATGVVTTPIGVAGSIGVVLGALPAGLSEPFGIAISGGRLYVTSENAVLTAPVP
jgi:hypothetical protein